MSDDAPPDDSLSPEVTTGVGLMSLENQESIHKEDSPVTHTKTDKPKIDILLKATGNAPIMKKRKWAVDAEKSIGWIMEFVKKYLKLDAEDKLFLYVNQTFAPSPDQIVRNLYDCFGTDGKLILHYCKTQAWG